MNHTFRLLAFGFAVAAASCVHLPTPPLPGGASKSDAPFSFVVVVDTPYSEKDKVFLDNQILPAIKCRSYFFIIHVGDDKSGGAPWTDHVIGA